MGHQAPAFPASTGLPKSSSGPQGSLFRGSLSWSGWLALSSCRGFRQTPEPGFLESKLLPEHREWVFHFGSDMSLGPLHPLCTVPSASSGQWRCFPGGQSTSRLPSPPASPGLGSPHLHRPSSSSSPCKSSAATTTSLTWAAVVAADWIKQSLCPPQCVSSWQKPLVPFASLIHLWILFPLPILRGDGGIDDGGIGNGIFRKINPGQGTDGASVNQNLNFSAGP